MNRTVLVGWLAIALPTIRAATAQSRPGESGPASSVARFRYQPERIEVGKVYHYLKTNLDGSNATRVAIYVQSRSRVEVLKAYPQTPYLYHVTADMDWSRFEADHLMQWALHRDGSRTLQLSAIENDAGTELALRVGGAGPAGPGPVLSVPIAYHPVHVYSFDFISLSLTFRHLVDPRGEFRIGVIGATSGSTVAYQGEARVRFVRDETRHGVECLVYEVGGPGLANTIGTIWVNRALRHVEDMEFALPDTPGWQSFKLQLDSVETMNDFQWNEWMLAQAKAVP